MKIKYQTGIVTLFQFISMSVLGFANGVNSTVSTCHSGNGDCVSNMLVTLIFTIFLVLWFGFVWILGLTAQDRRSKRLSQMLIGAELAIALVATFNAKHHTDWLSLFTSLLDLSLAIWVIFLAWRLMRSGGGRIVTGQRRRQRKTPQ